MSISEALFSFGGRSHSGSMVGRGDRPDRGMLLLVLVRLVLRVGVVVQVVGKTKLSFSGSVVGITEVIGVVMKPSCSVVVPGGSGYSPSLALPYTTSLVVRSSTKVVLYTTATAVVGGSVDSGAVVDTAAVTGTVTASVVSTSVADVVTTEGV